MKHLSRSFFKLTKKRLIVFLILLLLVGSGVFFFTRPAKTAASQYATVTRQDIKETISASGTLTGKNRATLKFKTSGKLAYLNVKEGAEVKKGAVIAGLDTQDLSIALQQAQNDYRAKQAAVEKALDEVKDHSKDETFAQKQTRTVAEAARDSAFDSVKAAQRAFQDAVITTPIAGTVVNTDVVSGQTISPTDVIAEIIDWSEIIFEAEVDEADIGRLSLGQKAEVTLNSYSDKTFEGVVEKINPQTKTTSSGTTVILVSINLGTPSIQKIANLNGQVNIITSQVYNALTIPEEAIVDEKYVYVDSDQGKKKVEVVTGLVGENGVEIKSGLAEGDKVITNPQAIKK